MPLADTSPWAAYGLDVYLKLVVLFAILALPSTVGMDMVEQFLARRAARRKPTPPQRQASQWRHPTRVD